MIVPVVPAIMPPHTVARCVFIDRYFDVVTMKYFYNDLHSQLDV